MRLRPCNALLVIAGLTWLVVAPAASADHSRLERISTGPAGGNGARGAVATSISRNGHRVTFYTEESLVPQDTDSTGDVYLRSRGRLTLASVGPLGGNGPHDAYGYLTPDGSVVFRTAERLTADDTDTAIDLYRYRSWTGVTALLTPDPIAGFFDERISPNASRLLFFTADALAPDDTDANFDLYLSTPAGIRLVTAAPDAATSNVSYCFWLRETLACNWAAFYASGRRILFMSSERLVDADADALPDWYALTGGNLELLTPGALTARDGDLFPTDGTSVFFSTNAALDPADTDDLVDVYEVSAGIVGLLTPDSAPAFGLTRRDVRLRRVTDDGGAILVETFARLIQADGDDNEDIYLFRDGTPQLISTGSLPITYAQYPHASLQAATPDGSHVVFTTGEKLEPEDTDEDVDIYLRSGSSTALVSTGPQDVCPFESSCSPGDYVRFLSDDGRRVFFDSYKQLVPEDTDSQSDLYERFAGVTTLISVGPNEANISPFCGTCLFSRDGRRVVFHTTAQLLPEDADDRTDVYAATANAPPDCGPVHGTPATLLPADRRWRSVELGGASDPDGDPLTIRITGVTQDERVGPAPDAALAGGAGRVLLRAERDALGDGRVYRVAFTASDGLGGSCSGTATVHVPRRQGAATDSAPPSYDSFRR
ncbi:MAG TPA: hypothetical protein VFB51_13115 [Solirubrobacterales bacterium]|nr:hypothetical protein [Solirubrobacterales bacterium]